MRNKNTRKGHGEGTIYQRPDGFWIGQITLGRGDDGKQKRKSFSAKTQKELVAKMKEFQYKQMHGDLIKTDNITFGSWLELWLKNYKKPILRQTTYENYETLIKVHLLNSNISKIQVQKLTTDQIQKFLIIKSEKGKIVGVRENNSMTMRDKGLSPKTLNSLHFLIRQALEQAKKNGIITQNVADACQKFKNEKKEIKPLTPDEVATLLTVVKEHHLYPALVLELATGIRKGELLALRWESINFLENTVSISENLVRIKGGVKFHNPKTKSSVRTIYIPTKVTKLLENYRNEQVILKNSRLAKGEFYNEHNNLVFCQQNGNPYNPRHFQRIFERWAKKAKLPKGTRFHDLRHTFITNLIGRAKIDIKTVQSITGHSDTQTLLGTYTHVIQEAQKQAAQSIGNLIPDV